MNNYDEKQFVNIGIGEDISIKELAELIKDIIGYQELFPSIVPNLTERRENSWMSQNYMRWAGNIELTSGKAFN